MPGLTVGTLSSYTHHDRTTLVRGEDYFVRRISPYRRQMMFTEIGLRKLQLRAYKVYTSVLRGPSPMNFRFGNKPGVRLPPSRARRRNAACA